MVRSADYQNPRFARAYLAGVDLADRRGGYEHRRRLVAGLEGRVIEVGAGSGRNFPHYPPTVTEVVAVEPDDTLRAHAVHAAAAAQVRATVVPGHGEDLPGEPGTYDAAVVSLVLCTVPSPERALREIVRLLRPGAALRFYEHVRSPNLALGLLEDLVTPAWRRLAGGCCPNRDTRAAIERAGFTIDDVTAFPFSPQPGVPRLTHLLGTAHLPL
ncbi:Methyltransferase domain-containing protein [Nonomuraea maritima]|uniref:Methyltransferase domain-containing protein n=1 Tax=Nonomuraea maritima TaxID=683260 RepID=A0A1G9DHX5_9ACTN|nr:class I SAM-dependent methyltransferase [Nonomuraea maritima]SDK63497.1 Methyltransferase domain-containing protein [Nonomuraea maritima]